MEAKTLAERIAAHNESVEELLGKNYKLSVSLLTYKLLELKEETQKRFLEYRRVELRVKEQESALAKLKQRLGVKFDEIQVELDKLRVDQPKSQQAADSGVDPEGPGA